MKRFLQFGFPVALLLASVTGALASFTIEGEPDALVVEATEASRSEIVNGIVERFGIEASGEAIQSGTVTGSFSGDLRQVLVAIAPGNGYAIAYSDGRPSRITFTINQAASDTLETPGVAASGGAGAPIAAPPVAAAAGANEPPTIERIMERQMQRLATAGSPETGDRKNEAQPEADVAAMTKQARQELEALVRAIRQSQP